MQTKTELRKSLRQQRQNLSPEFITTASANIVNQLSKLPVFQKAQRVALYLANDREADISALCSQHPEKHYYLPILTPSKQLNFASYQLGNELRANSLGILEPFPPRLTPALELDLVCVPLVGFDLSGQRLGMGGGYYDRTFAFKNAQQSTGPFLLGIAYECQKVTQVPQADWDIPLDGILTDQEIYTSK
jgi:5-formyltetrahydrofolate cyclo-ligase